MDMNIRTISRDQITINRKATSQYRPLIDAIGKLTPGGDGIEVTYRDRSHLNSMRNTVYTYNREQGTNIKSSDSNDGDKVYFYIPESYEVQA